MLQPAVLISCTCTELHVECKYSCSHICICRIRWHLKRRGQTNKYSSDKMKLTAIFMYLIAQHAAHKCYKCSVCCGTTYCTMVLVQVPPMPPAQTKEVIESQLNAKLEQVFEWINLEKPLGSASISQVRDLISHATTMRHLSRPGCHAAWFAQSWPGVALREMLKRNSRTLSLHWLDKNWPAVERTASPSSTSYLKGQNG